MMNIVLNNAKYNVEYELRNWERERAKNLVSGSEAMSIGHGKRSSVSGES